MADEKLNAYAVSFTFGSGKEVLNATVAPSPQAAAAICMFLSMKNMPDVAAETQLTVSNVMPLDPIFLAAAHRIVNEGQRPGGTVLSLVPTQPEPLTEAMMAAPDPDVPSIGMTPVPRIEHPYMGRQHAPGCAVCGLDESAHPTAQPDGAA